MEKFSLKLDDAPLILSAYYPNASIDITWLKQTSYTKPLKLAPKLAGEYEDKMEWILRQYHALQKQDGLRQIAPHVLPYAAKVGLGLQASRRELARSIPELSQTPTGYTKQLAQSLSDGLKVPEHTTVDKLPDKQAGIARDRKRVRLVDVQPLNELELITPSLYEKTALSWHDALDSQESLSYQQKELQLRRLLGLGLLPDGLRYRFEVVVEPQILRELNHKLQFASVYAQPPTPAHGYSVPKVNDGGMIERCFDMSFELYSALQQSNPQAAPLACLYGHRQRYLLDITGSRLGVLYDRSVKFSPSAINVIKFLRKEIALKHQNIGSWFEDKEKSSGGKREASSSED